MRTPRSGPTIRRLTAIGCVSVWLLMVGSGTTAIGATFQNWPAYLFDIHHVSANVPSTAITTASVGSLAKAWSWVPHAPTKVGQPPAYLYASPTVYNGVVYIGAYTGVFYALNESNGSVVWHRFLGYEQATADCPIAKGFTGTATVAADPITGEATVYVDSGNGYLYALNAATGAVDWRSLVASASKGYYNWSSPTVAGGHVYVGISERDECAPPLPGGLRSYDQATGARLATYWTPTGSSTYPTGLNGGAVWTSAAADGSSVWITTGDAASAATLSDAGDAYSMVRLNSSLVKQESYQIPNLYPTDLDYGASPVVFAAILGGVKTQMVGACDKNGIFYAFRAQNVAAGPVWQTRVGAHAKPKTGGGSPGCISAAVWDWPVHQLIMAANEATIGSTVYPATMRALDPATGHADWETGLPSGPVDGSPTINGSGVAAAVTYSFSSPNDLFLVDASDGSVLRTIGIGSPAFAQPVFADNFLFVATATKGLAAYS